MEDGNQSPRHEGAEAGHGVLAQRQLPRIAREYHHREQDDRHPHRDGEGVDPFGLLGQHQEDHETEPEQHPVPRKTTIADHRQLPQEIVAQG